MRQGRHEALADGLGWFSIALGLAEVLMPRALARAAGLEGRERLVQIYGIREIATGIVILLSADKTPGLWARVAGDALDAATLATGEQPRAAAAMAAVAPVVALDIWAATGPGDRREKRSDAAVDYSAISGFSRPAAQMRGVARATRSSSGASSPSFASPVSVPGA